MARIVIVGGGISGLAWPIVSNSRCRITKVVLLERRQRTGGVIDTIARDGFRVETVPNGFLDNNPATSLVPGNRPRRSAHPSQ